MAEDSRIGLRVFDYELVRLLGEGGMARVYLGQSGIGRRVAVKTLSPELHTEK